MTWSRRVRPSLALAALLAAAPAAVQGAVPARDAVLLLSGEEGGMLPIEVAAHLEPPAEGGASAVVAVEVPAWSLLELAGDQPLPLFVAIYAVGGEGEVRASAAERYRIAPAGLVAAGAAGLRLSSRLALPPGEVSLRVLLKVGTEGAEFGLRVVPLTVPAAEGEPDWLAIELRPRAGRWLAPEGGDGGAAPVLPVIASAERLEVELLARGRPVREPVIELVPGGKAPSQQAGPEAVPLELRDLERLGGGAGGWNRFRGRLDLPALGDGRYRLRFQPPAGGRPLEFVATRGDAETVTWAELIRSEGAGPEPIPGGTERARPSAAMRRLDDALESYAAAGADELEPLEELFLDEWRRAGTAGATALVEAGNRLAWDLLEREPDALVPLIAASAQLYRRFLDRQQWGLSTAARRLTVIFLDVYSRGASEVRSVSERAPVAATGWASFAGDLLEAGLLARSSALYKRALEIDARQKEALLVLAAIYERAGQYGDAAQSYRRLLDLAPDDAELHLRLALQQARIGHQNDAQRRLSGLLTEESPDWVEQLAAQELARMHLDSGRTAEASGVVEAALARHPDNEKLLLLRAAVAELAGTRADGDLLAALEGQPAARTPSARHRYAAWPPQALGGARDRLAEAAAERRPALIQALRQGGRR